MNKSYIVSLITSMLIMLQSICCHAYSGYIINTTDQHMQLEIFTGGETNDGQVFFEIANTFYDFKLGAIKYIIAPHSSTFYTNKATGPRDIKIRQIIKGWIPRPGKGDLLDVIQITTDQKPYFYQSKQWGGDYIIYKDGDTYGVSKR